MAKKTTLVSGRRRESVFKEFQRGLVRLCEQNPEIDRLSVLQSYGAIYLDDGKIGSSPGGSLEYGVRAHAGAALYKPPLLTGVLTPDKETAVRADVSYRRIGNAFTLFYNPRKVWLFRLGYEVSLVEGHMEFKKSKELCRRAFEKTTA